MTERTYIKTNDDVVSMVMSYDSKFAMALTHRDDEHFEVNAFSLDTNEPVFKIVIEGTYLKMNLID